MENDLLNELFDAASIGYCRCGTDGMLKSVNNTGKSLLEKAELLSGDLGLKTASLTVKSGFFPFRGGYGGAEIRAAAVPGGDICAVLIEKKRNFECDDNLEKLKKSEPLAYMGGSFVHDFNNALTGIMGNLSLAKIENRGMNSELDEIISEAEKSSYKMKELIRRLDFYALPGKPLKKKMDLAAITAKQVKSLAEHGIARIDLETDEGELQVDADPGQLALCVRYLAEYALSEGAADAAVKLKVFRYSSDKNRTFMEMNMNCGEYAALCVQNPACAADEKMLEPSATGFNGLAVVYAIVRRHRGFIELPGGEEKGRDLTVYFPLSLIRQGS